MVETDILIQKISNTFHYTYLLGYRNSACVRDKARHRHGRRQSDQICMYKLQTIIFIR